MWLIVVTKPLKSSALKPLIRIQNNFVVKVARWPSIENSYNEFDPFKTWPPEGVDSRD